MSATRLSPDVAVRRLVVGRVPENFSPDADIVPGPWCFADREHVYPEWEDLPFVQPFADAGEAKLWNDRLGVLGEAIVHDMTGTMNRRHGVDRSPRFWFLLLSRWVLEVALATYYRYREVESLLALYSDVAMTAEVPAANTDWGFTGLADFFNRGIVNPEFNSWIFGLVLRQLAPDRVEISETDIAIPEATDTPSPQKFTAGLQTWVKGGRAEFGGGICEYSLGTKARSFLMHVLASTYLSVMPRKSHIRAGVPTKKPEAKDHFPPAFLSVLDTVLAKTMPMPYGPHFNRYNAAARKHRAVKGRLNVRTPAFHLDDTKLFEIAHRIDNGEGLVFVQHGANYGVCHAYALASQIEYRQHAFFGWGWDRHDNYKGTFVPLPAPQLRSWRKSHRETSKTILMVAGSVPLVPSRLDSVGEVFVKTDRRRDRVAFIKSLPDDLRDHVMYRPYQPLNWCVEDGPYMARHFPDLSQSHSLEDFFAHIRGCRLLVIDHPGTTFYMALAARVPMICFWKDRHWPMGAKAQHLFDDLRDAGVLFDDATVGAAQVENIWHDVAGWWGSAEVSAAVAAIRRWNAHSSSLWWYDWMKALWKL